MPEANAYALCTNASEKAYWSLTEAVGGLKFDFSRRFVPLKIFGGTATLALSEGDRLQLNQIRGCSYAHLFLFVEEFIIMQVIAQARGHLHRDPDAVRALLRFAEEETKHQGLFRAVKSRINAGLGAECGAIGGMNEVADFIVAKPPMAVMLLTCLLEWITQRHYLECFRDNKELDPAFAEVFRLHWVEESQHARLDMLELQTMATTTSAAERERAVDVMVELLAAVDGLLRQQVDLDLATLEALTGRPLPREQRAALVSDQHAAYRWTFITSGLEHRVFQRVAGELSAAGAARLPAVMALYV